MKKLLLFLLLAGPLAYGQQIKPELWNKPWKASWITSHSGVPGTNVSTFTDKIAEVSVTNTLGNINGIADEAGVLGLVYGNRVKQMPAMIRYRLRKPVAKFNKK
jgi:hypothetical protein